MERWKLFYDTLESESMSAHLTKRIQQDWFQTLQLLSCFRILSYSWKLHTQLEWTGMVSFYPSMGSQRGRSLSLRPVISIESVSRQPEVQGETQSWKNKEQISKRNKEKKPFRMKIKAAWGSSIVWRIHIGKLYLQEMVHMRLLPYLMNPQNPYK